MISKKIQITLDNKSPKKISVKEQLTDTQKIMYSISKILEDYKDLERILADNEEKNKVHEWVVSDYKLRAEKMEKEIQDLQSSNLALQLTGGNNDIRKQEQLDENFYLYEKTLFLAREKGIYESSKKPNYFLGEATMSTYTEEVSKKLPIEGYVIHIEKRQAEHSNALKLPVGASYKEVVLTRTM